MESKDEVTEIDHLERGLLLGDRKVSDLVDDDEDSEESVLHKASFEETEENFVKYQSSRWVLYSLLLILAWGIGLLMLIYLPLRSYILRKEIRSRKLYLTPNAIVYKVRRPVPFPCFGNLKKEKYVLLPSVADIVIEQGYLQSRFGVYSIRIENVGVRRPPSEDFQIQGVVNPQAFRKAVLERLSHMRDEVFSGQGYVENVLTPRFGQSTLTTMSPSKSLGHDSYHHLGEMAILQKLEEVGSSVKRVQSLIEEQNPQTLDD